MTILSYALRWLPLPLLAAVCVQELGWTRAGVILLLYLAVPRHWFFSLLVVVASVSWLGIPSRYFFWAVVYRLVWDLGLKTVFGLLIGARQRTHRTQMPRAVPGFRCGHGLGKRIEAADRLAGFGVADEATDAYLKILADHPFEPSCGRALLLRTAEAARAAGNHTLAAESSAAALRGVPRDPTGRLATIAVRAHTTRAAALAVLGELDEGTRSLRQAQRLKQANRGTERYLRWTAAEVRLAGRRVRTLDELGEEIAGALSEQKLPLAETAGRHQLTIPVTWRLLEAGDGEGAKNVFYSVRRELDLDPAAPGLWHPDGGLRVPAERQPAWRMFTLAVAGELAAAVANDEELSADDRTAIDLAVDLAWYLDENLTGARMLLTVALFDRRRGGDAEEAVARLRRAQRFADFGLHTFADQHRQVEWMRVRQEIAAALQIVAGIDEPPVTSPWPVTPTEREQAENARARAEALFDRLAANDPEAFNAARQRVASQLDDATFRELCQPPTQEAVAPVGKPPTQPEAKPKSRPTPKAIDPPPPEPGWLEPLMAAAGGRCWTLPLALELARSLGHGHVGPEHLVLAVARDGECAEILAGLDVRADDLRAMVGAWYARTGTTSPVLDPELTALARDASSVADRLGESRVRAAHLLMAVLANPHGVGGTVLRARGADLEEARVRADAALAGPVLQERARPLLTAGKVVHQHRLTLPAWLAIGRALDLAAAEQGRILGVEHLADGVEAYGSKVAPPPDMEGRGTVRIGRWARDALTAARLGADAVGEWGIDLDHLRLAIRCEEPVAQSPGWCGTRAACERAARRGARFVTPEDVCQAPFVEGPGNLLPPVPVLTPSARRAFDRERSTA